MSVFPLRCLVLVAVGAASACGDVPGSAAAVVRVELPGGEMPRQDHVDLRFAVSSTGDQEKLLAAREYEWITPFDSRTFTIRGIAISRGESVQIQARLFASGSVELGGDQKEVLLKPGTPSELIVLTIKWATLPDAGSPDPAGPDSGASSPDGGSREAGSTATTDAPRVVCSEGQTTLCGSCGTMRCTQGNWGECRGDGRTQTCSDCGQQTCQNWGSWTSCQGNGSTRTCGQCGFQQCLVVGIYSACQPSGNTRPCPTGAGTQRCGSGGNWDFICQK
jgi:hypothetical protein